MAEAAPVTAPALKPAEVLAKFEQRLTAAESALVTKDAEIADLKTKALAAPQYNVAGVIGGIPRDSEGYSVIKAARYASGRVSEEGAKYEIDISNKLGAMYKSMGWKQSDEPANRRMLIPFSTYLIPQESSEMSRTVVELKQKMIADAEKVDPNEVNWLRKRMGMGMVTKDLGTISDVQGGVIVGFPTLGELIDMQRFVEVFAQAGATEIGLPPNGRMQFPKLSSSTTANWVGEAKAITESTPGTGSLDLQAKKLGIWVDLNNELIRFGSVSAEAMVRTDMSKVAALKIDLAMLEGTGGTQIKGLITYPSASAWTPGTDPLLTFAVTSNKLQVANGASMEALLPDTAGEPTAWVMRRDLWAILANRRAAAFTTVDNEGPFLANITRGLGDRMPLEWNGTKVVRSGQVSKTRNTGARTYVILGNFKDWITARFGALEFLSTMTSDQAFQNDQTQIRCIQHVDAGPRHASSFVFADEIDIS
jgi:HK97 family phage major capsid protein